MGLNVQNLMHGVLYKIMDENDVYYTQGIWYLRKIVNPNTSNEPILYVYHFDLDGKLINIYCGHYVDIKNQNGVEFTINGWTIDKNSSIENVGNKNTIKEMTFSFNTLLPVTSIECDLLDREIMCCLEDPTKYFNNEKKGSK